MGSILPSRYLGLQNPDLSWDLCTGCSALRWFPGQLVTSDVLSLSCVPSFPPKSSHLRGLPVMWARAGYIRASPTSLTHTYTPHTQQ